ncbi:MAG: spore cortex biosynthesis protein YabQ [Clostridia bacterium]|nr:spore cortex biosynthesis protein YabQ [Clostridia bacterium]
MWEINNYNQTITFLLALGLGALFCVLYDVIRAVRKVCLNSFWSVTFTDIFIWVLYAFTTFIFLVARTNGEIRGYVLAGELLGFILFRISFSRLLFPSLRFVFIKIAAVKKKVTKCIGWFYIKFEAFVFKIGKSISKFFKSTKKLLKNALKLLYTNKNIADTEKALNETKTKA